MSFLTDLFSGVPLRDAFLIAGYFWWVWLPAPLAIVAWKRWLRYARLWYYWARIPWVMIEVRIPQEIFKTPKAMEQIFSGVWSIITRGSFYEQVWLGRWIDYMSFELLGTAGETHFYLCLPEGYRTMVESYVYSEYPEAEIVQAEDYFHRLPPEMPTEGWHVIGTELAFTHADPYPIRTYLQFEEPVEEQRLDPMSHFAELFNKLTEHEYIIYQLLVRPLGGDWVRRAKALVYTLIGKKLPKPARAPEIEETVTWWHTFWAGIWQFFFGGELTVAGQEAAEGEVGTSLMLHLSPGERATVEAIEKKTSKHAMEVNFRMVYVAREGYFKAKSIVSGMFGATGLFGGDLNGFKPHMQTKTWLDYFKKRREPRRQHRLWHEMRKRLLVDELFAHPFRPSGVLIMNIEELASIYHFPIKGVVAPLLPRIGAKKGEPPVGLPVG